MMPQANFHLSEAIMKINDNESQIIWMFHPLGNFGLHLLFAQKIEGVFAQKALKKIYSLTFEPRLCPASLELRTLFSGG
jgi:hypothetical protein